LAVVAANLPFGFLREHFPQITATAATTHTIPRVQRDDGTGLP
jgi:hypothetical protein